MSDAARRADLTAQIIELEPQMLHVLGPAQARDWVDADLTMSQLKMMFVLSSAMGPPTAPAACASARWHAGSGSPCRPSPPSWTSSSSAAWSRDEDPLDRRQHVCRLTADGQVPAPLADGRRRAFTQALLEHLDEDELAAFLRGMQVLIAAERLRASASADPAVACRTDRRRASHQHPGATAMDARRRSRQMFWIGDFGPGAHTRSHAVVALPAKPRGHPIVERVIAPDR